MRLAAGLVCLAFSGLSPAADKDLPADAEAIWGILETTQHQVQQMLEPQGGLEAAHALLRTPCRPAATPETSRALALRDEANAYRRDLGLELRGGYTLTERGVTDGNADQETSNRAYLELSWDILADGYRRKRELSASRDSEAALWDIQAGLQARRRQQHCRAQAISLAYDQLEARLLTLKQAMLEPIDEASRRSYLLGRRTLEEALFIRGELDSATTTLGSTQYRLDQAEISPSRLSARPPQVEVDMAAVHEALADSWELIEIARLEKDALQQAKEKQQINHLRLFARTEMTDGGSTSNNGALVAGVRFIVPLTSQKAPGLRHRLQEIDDQLLLDAWEQQARLQDAQRDLEAQTGRMVEQRYRFLRAQERARRSLTLHRLYPDEADVADAIRQTVEGINAAIELMRVQKEQYRRINAVFLQARVEPGDNHLRIVRADADSRRMRHGERALYLWSASFNQTSNQVIAAFLDAKRIDTLLLSAGKSTDQAKLRSLLPLLQAQGTTLELTLGENSWALPENHAKVVERAKAAARLGAAVHLDVEPHTLPIYKVNKAALLANYQEMVRKVRTALPPETALSLSVPIHWDPAVYAALAPHVTRLHLMAYDSDDAQRIARRIAPIIAATHLEKLSIALRISDFSDEWSIERTIDQLRRHTNIQAYSLHQFKDYFDMARKTR